jgi:SynChlorMet cassette protein ScmC
MKESKEFAGISLANGLRIGMFGTDVPASFFLSHLIEIMKLQPMIDPSLKILLAVEGNGTSANYKICSSDTTVKPKRVLSENSHWKAIEGKNDNEIICLIKKRANDFEFYTKLSSISVLLGFLSLNYESMVLHCALAHKDGEGVILVGRSGAGKTTASNLLPKPWKSLCDDVTWIVRDAQGKFWAHPLPTSSRFHGEGPGGSWDVAQAVPLKGIFFLNQNRTDSIQLIDTADTIRLLMSSSIYVLSSLFSSMNPEEKRALHCRVFEYIYSLSNEVPACILNFSLAGEFWTKMERFLDEN